MPPIPVSRWLTSRTAPPTGRDDVHRSVRAALAHLNDLAFLQTHALTRSIPAEGREGQAAVGAALRDALLRAIESLRPDARTPTGSPAHRRYQILLQRYVEGIESKLIQAKLGVAKTEYYREHQEAVGAVAALLHERWGGVAPTPLHQVWPATTVSDQAGGGRWESVPVPGRPLALPLPLASLVGRAAEMATARQLLSVERLVTLTGPPGVGKTTLALELARDLSGNFADGVYFVPLATIVDPALIVPAIAQVIHVGLDDTGPVEEGLARSLEAAHTLLVLDNFEQVVEAGPSVATLLQRCPHLCALVTSRAALEVRGEREMLVPPLGLPPFTEGLTARTAARFPSVQLFVERAQAAASGFELTDENASTVGQLCDRLDGLPLALELAAARCDVLSAEEILARLDRRLVLLTRGPRDLPPRQRTLEAAIDWSYDLLGPDEQALLRQLAVFESSWTLAGAEAVAETSNVVDGLATLVRSNLVQRQERGSTDVQPRFAMLETIKEYARARLTACGEIDIARRKHAESFALLAEKAAQTPAFRRSVTATAAGLPAEMEQADLRSALDWAIDHQDGPRALRLAAVLMAPWMLRDGSIRNAQRFAEVLALPGADEPTAARALAVERIGQTALEQGDYPAARQLLLDALDIYEALGDKRSMGIILMKLRVGALHHNLRDESYALNERGHRIFHEIGDPNGLASALDGSGELALFDGDLPAARAFFQEAFSTARHPQALRNLANMACDEGHLSEARERLAEYLGMVRAVGTVPMTAAGLEGFAGLAAAEAQPERAFRLAGAAAAFRRARSTPLQPWPRAQLERRLAPASAALDESARTAAWAAGQAMSVDEAIDYALSGESRTVH